MHDEDLERLRSLLEWARTQDAPPKDLIAEIKRDIRRIEKDRRDQAMPVQRDPDKSRMWK